MVKVCVIGVGAVGSILLLSAMLGGCETVGFSRTDRIIYVKGIIPYSFKVEALGSRSEYCDYVIISVKSYDTSSVLDYISSRLIGGSVYVVAQNGLEGLEIVESAVGNSVVAAAVINFGSIRRGNYVELKGIGPIVMGCKSKDCVASLEPLAVCLRNGGLKVLLARDVEMFRRRKLAINAIVNTLTTLLDTKNGIILENKVLKELAEVLALEASIILDVDYGSTLSSLFNVINDTRENISSMLQDLKECRRLELDSILGPLADRSTTFLILHHLIKALEVLKCSGRKDEQKTHGGCC